jgi:hypothetical protein
LLRTGVGISGAFMPIEYLKKWRDMET